MTPEFVLGFISGEGSFTTMCSVNDEAKYGVYPTIRFKLNVKEKEVLDEIQSFVGVGNVTVEADRDGQYVWRITSNSELKEFSEWVENHSDCGFEESKKYDSFVKWRNLVEEREELLKSKDGIKEFIRRSREINEESARTTGRSVEELISIVDSSTNYICGVESEYSDCCENPVDKRNGKCHLHSE